MHHPHAVAMARTLRALTTRPLTRGALVTGVLGLFGLAHAEEVGAGKSNKCNPDCKECQFCQKGNCKKNNHGKKSCKPGKCKNLTNGTLCTKPSGGVCQAGLCACTGGLTNCAGTCRSLQT